MRTLRLVLIAVLSGLTAIAQTQPSPSSTAPAVEPKPPTVSLPELSTSLESLVNRVRPAVVQIFSTGYVAADETDSSSTAAVLSKQRSTGSGIILSADGFIVTNSHVVRGARQILVRLSGVRRGTGGHPIIDPEGQLLEAKLIGMDRDMDVAVIKIERNALPYLHLGNSDQVRQGELVMAFGNPLGLEGSVSMGIVSSTERQIHPDDMLAYIQTDAPINPGNSGGPLVDPLGRVIGINTFILSQSGGSEGIGFAIPSNMVNVVYEQLRREGHVHRGRIGISVQTITPEIAAGLKLPRDWGVVVGDVIPGGPADKGGVKIGDVVLALNGRTLRTARQLESYIYRSPMKGEVMLEVERGSEQLNLEVPVIDSVDDPQRFADMVNPENNLVRRLGILAISIDKNLAAMLPDLRHSYGVVVAAGSTSTDLTSGTGLQPGDVIYSVNGTMVTSVDALRKQLDEFKSGATAVAQIERSGHLMYVPVELE